jgi:hypothetical protein
MPRLGPSYFTDLIDLAREISNASSELTKALNRNSMRGWKGRQKELNRAVIKFYKLVLGRAPTQEELKKF